MNKIIYSFKIMEQLVEKGYFPVRTMPNPKFPKYNCWVFAATEEFNADLDKILGGQKDGQ